MESAVHQPPRRGGNVLVRGLLQRLAARDERMPVEHALGIVISAAAYVHTAHGRGTRVFVSPERILVGFDGSVTVEPAMSDPEFDAVTGLGDLLIELLGDQPVPPSVRSVVATISADRYAFDTAWGFARAVSQAAKGAKLSLSREELGKWAHRQVHPPKLAHTVQRDIPVLGVDIGTQKPPPKLAIGSGLHEELDEPDFPDEDFESVTTEGVFEVDVDLDDLLRFEEPTPPQPVRPQRVSTKAVTVPVEVAAVAPIAPAPPPPVVTKPQALIVEPGDVLPVVRPRRRGRAMVFVLIALGVVAIGAAVGVVVHVKTSDADRPAQLRLATGARGTEVPPAPALYGGSGFAVAGARGTEGVAGARVSKPAAPVTNETPAIAPALAATPTISNELAAEVATCRGKTRSSSRRVRVACAIAACRVGDTALHDALVAPLGASRKADVAKKCAAADVD
jgi:hypothetical protein